MVDANAAPTKRAIFNRNSALSLGVSVVALDIIIPVFAILMGWHLDGQVAKYILWASGILLLLSVTGYYVLYQREVGRPVAQFHISTLFVLLTLAAFVAWAWRAGQGVLMLMLIVSGMLIYWRGWKRRHEQISRLGLLVLGLLMAFFLLYFLIFVYWMWFGPKIQYDVPITEQRQGIIK